MCHTLSFSHLFPLLASSATRCTIFGVAACGRGCQSRILIAQDYHRPGRRVKHPCAAFQRSSHSLLLLVSLVSSPPPLSACETGDPLGWVRGRLGENTAPQSARGYFWRRLGASVGQAGGLTKGGGASSGRGQHGNRFSGPAYTHQGLRTGR